MSVMDADGSPDDSRPPSPSWLAIGEEDYDEIYRCSNMHCV